MVHEIYQVPDKEEYEERKTTAQDQYELTHPVFYINPRKQCLLIAA
jgi:hypothetical protein